VGARDALVRLVGAAPTVLGAVLAGMADDHRRRGIDEPLASRDRDLIRVGFDLNDIRILLNRGADPQKLRASRYRGIVADDDPDPPPLEAGPPPANWRDIAMIECLDSPAGCLPPIESYYKDLAAQDRESTPADPLAGKREALAAFVAGAPIPAEFTYPAPIGADEWDRAELAPPCIVDRLLWADVGVRVAPGGNGKTTLEMFEAVHIVLGRPLFGLPVRRPGPVLIITAEDSRQILVARLREICQDLELTASEVAMVMNGVRIADLSAAPAKITCVLEDVVTVNHRVAEIIDACRPHPPVLVVFDPAISFGVGERRVNDAEQALVEAGRRIRAALGCAVKFIHHSGQVSAREKLIDQYAGRGGTAFADGCRMVHVLQSLTADEFARETGRTLDDGETGLILARPKLSYCPPQPPLFLVRRGYLFRAVEPAGRDPGAELAAVCNQVEQLIGEELRAGRYPTQRSLEGMAKSCNLTRDNIRDAVANLRAAGRIATMQAPRPEGRGGRHDYLGLFGARTANRAPNGKNAE